MPCGEVHFGSNREASLRQKTIFDEKSEFSRVDMNVILFLLLYQLCKPLSTMLFVSLEEQNLCACTTICARCKVPFCFTSTPE